jgi:hypothetical protein
VKPPLYTLEVRSSQSVRASRFLSCYIRFSSEKKRIVQVFMDLRRLRLYKGNGRLFISSEDIPVLLIEDEHANALETRLSSQRPQN